MAEYKDRLVTINYELRDCREKEERLLFEDPFWKKAMAARTGNLRAKIEEKIPEKLEETLNTAFNAAFKMVFQEGSSSKKPMTPTRSRANTRKSVSVCRPRAIVR